LVCVDFDEFGKKGGAKVEIRQVHRAQERFVRDDGVD
jgi:hypothetical protein